MTTKQSMRYFVCQTEWGPPCGSGGEGHGGAVDPATSTSSDLFSALRAMYQEVVGDAGWGGVASTLSVVFFSPATRLSVVRCPAAREEECRACLSLIRVVRRRGVAVHVLQCVSTVRALKEALQRVSGGVVHSLKEAQGGVKVLDDAFFAALEEEALGAI